MIRIGKIAATHGLNGALILTHIIGNSKWLKKEQPLMVEMNKGSQIPFFLTHIKVSNDEEYIIQLEEIIKIDDAKKLVGKPVYVNETALADYARNSPLLWIGFTIRDKNKGDIGKIEDVLMTGTQWIAQITYQEKEVLIPLVDGVLDGLNMKSRTVQVTLPEGLLEVYL